MPAPMISPLSRDLLVQHIADDQVWFACHTSTLLGRPFELTDQWYSNHKCILRQALLCEVNMPFEPHTRPIGHEGIVISVDLHRRGSSAFITELTRNGFVELGMNPEGMACEHERETASECQALLIMGRRLLLWIKCPSVSHE